MSAFKFTADQLNHAAELLIDSQFGSAHMLTRRMGIGFGTAGAILDRLQELNVIGPNRPDGAREVLVKSNRKLAALACITGGHRYDPDGPVLAGRDTVKRDALVGAYGLAYSAMPDHMADVEARQTAERIVGLLADAGWRPTEPAAR